MTKAILYKEWIKVRWLLLLVALVYSATVVFTLVKVNRSFRFAGAVHLWDMIIQKDLVLVDYLNYLPVIGGVLIALGQFVPEMTKRKFKLTLHLPMPHLRPVWAMMVFGLGSLVVINLCATLVVSGVLQFKVAPEMLWAWSQALTPCLLAGLAAYLLTTWICIEPVWSQRVINGMIGGLLIYLHFLSAPSGGYRYLVPVLFVLDSLCCLFVFYSVARFRQGAQ
ncbi:MAG: hypothetical protein JEZ14_05630 [Marinilabiliaceae bacterium]|nr:hypothetical protein [Marinilabiliaceae bacterium]